MTLLMMLVIPIADIKKTKLISREALIVSKSNKLSCLELFFPIETIFVKKTHGAKLLKYRKNLSPSSHHNCKLYL